MDEFFVVLLCVVGAILICFIPTAVYLSIRSQEEQTYIVENKDEIRDIYSQYAQDPRLEVYHILYLTREYMEVTKLVTYKKIPKDPHYKEKLYEEIIKVDYFTSNRL